MVELSQALPEHDSFLFGLYASTRRAELQAWGWDELMQQQFLQMQWTAQQRSYAMQYPDADHSLVLYRNLQAGRLLVTRSEEEIVLVDIALLPEFQNRGIGAFLIRQLQEEAAASARPLRLSVLSTNPAHRLYERIGFVQIAESGLHIRMEWQAPQVSTPSDHNDMR